MVQLTYLKFMIYLINFAAVTTYDFSVNIVEGLNVLGLVVFSVAFGIVISRLGETGKPLYAFFFGMAEAMMKLVILVIW